MKHKIAITLVALAFGLFVNPAEAHHSFWHQVKDQVYNSHGWQYGYGAYPPPVNYHGTNYGYSNPWGTYGVQQGWGHAQYGGHSEYTEHGGYHHD
jgi:hypothetical protein